MKWTLRHYVKPGDIGQLTYLHGTVYATEYQCDTKFEAYVASGIADFVQSFNVGKIASGWQKQTMLSLDQLPLLDVLNVKLSFAGSSCIPITEDMVLVRN